MLQIPFFPIKQDPFIDTNKCYIKIGFFYFFKKKKYDGEVSSIVLNDIFLRLYFLFHGARRQIPKKNIGWCYDYSFFPQLHTSNERFLSMSDFSV